MPSKVRKKLKPELRMLIWLVALTFSPFLAYLNCSPTPLDVANTLDAMS